MKKWITIILFGALLVLTFVQLASAGVTRYEYFLGDDTASQDFYGANWRSQTFTIGVVASNVSFIVTNVSLDLQRTGSPGTFVVGIREIDLSTGKPTGPDIANGTFDANTLSDGAFALTNIPMTLNRTIYKGKMYGIVARAPSGDASNNVVYRGQNNDVGYPAGTHWSSGDSGSTWAAVTNKEADFEIFGIEVFPVYLIVPTNNTSTSTTPINFTSTFDASILSAPLNTSMVNATLYVWYSNSTVYNTSIKSITGNGTNITSFNLTSLAMGTFQWNVLLCGNNQLGGSACGWALNNLTINFGNSVSSNSYNTTTAETARESFITNLTIPSGQSVSSAKLFWNGTNHTATVSNASATNYTLSKTINIPTFGTNVNVSWFWELTYGSGVRQNTSSNTQEVRLLNLSICGAAPQNIPYINFTFKDESNLSRVLGAVATSTWNYYTGNGEVNKTLVFQDTTYRQSYAFCLSPGDRSIQSSLSFQYIGSSYPQRLYNPSVLTLTNTTTNTVLYLLNSADGIYSSFQAIEASGSTISGVAVTAERLINNEYIILETGTTDSSGLATFWLNPNYDHRITASKSGYLTSQVTVRPTQTIYSIIMSRSTGDATFNGSLKGLKWSILPRAGTLSPGTYTFYFNLTSSLNNIDSCKMELVYASNSTILASGTGGSSAGCNLSLTGTFIDGDFIFGKYYVDTTDSDGYFLIDRDARWKWLQTNARSWLNIRGFITDLKDAPDFGTGLRAEYSKIMLFFFFITLLIGLFAYFTGYDAMYPGALMFLIMIIVFFFSTAGWFTIDFGTNTPDFIEKYYVFLISLFISTGWIALYYSRT